ncbi:MAG: DUF4846 domain-containing protein [bacterium]|jgi:hypothetical protein
MAIAKAAAVATALALIWANAVSPDPEEPARRDYPWLDQYDPRQALALRVEPPPGYRRVEAEQGSFAAWLRGLPLRPPGAPIRHFDGRLKSNQSFHHAVVDMDVGELDLQQCADVAMRLRAEYLFSRGECEKIHFDFTSGDRAHYLDWREGFRPVVRGGEVKWHKLMEADGSYTCFRDYLDKVFEYAGTYSLSRELMAVARPGGVEAGDVFVDGGFPGHAVMVMDIAERVETGERIMLLAQGFMPAQDLQILKNFRDPSISPWYPADFGEWLDTPDWSFGRSDLHRWPAD